MFTTVPEHSDLLELPGCQITDPWCLAPTETPGSGGNVQLFCQVNSPSGYE